MKILKLTLGVMAALSLMSSVSQAATTTVYGGQVHFIGTVVNAACAVDANSTNQTVNLGQVRTARLATAGSKGTAVGFNIQLDDCDTTVASTAAIAFKGTAVNAANPSVLALQSSAAGGATNVGVQIVDAKGSVVALDGVTYSAASTLSNGTNVIPFQAYYYATGAATAGSANADTNFYVQYQ
ncbi:type 1 fimbrial major subunit FimA [Pantoea ananatis]|uniref:type 1 fimbrial major subunit FimA n=1 Tax=Pantoea ananas TaxID=553 RepID=UPI000F882CBD|nr:type 1 fimbrial major subunit FimA [Pantoea ananatis]RQN05301.1 type-1 fimbrial protein subunit A [Pantoea ananatis]